MLKAWTQWKRECALATCDDETREHLRTFAAALFWRYADAFISKTNLTSASNLPHTAADAWHLLETRLTTSSTRKGKRYKDWLFDRTRWAADPALKVLQGGVRVFVRDVVRDVLRNECFDARVDSLDAPARADGDGELSVVDLLPGGLSPSDDAVHRDFERLAREHAPRVIADMLDRERIALFAKAVGLSLANPELEVAAGCRKSMLNAAYHGVIRRVSERLLREYPDDDRESVLLLTLKTLEEVNSRLVKWGKSQKSLAKLLMYIEGHSAPAKDVEQAKSDESVG